jgi:hypothetical protein
MPLTPTRELAHVLQNLLFHRIVASSFTCVDPGIDSIVTTYAPLRPFLNPYFAQWCAELSKTVNMSRNTLGRYSGVVWPWRVQLKPQTLSLVTERTPVRPV